VKCDVCCFSITGVVRQIVDIANVAFGAVRSGEMRKRRSCHALCRAGWTDESSRRRVVGFGSGEMRIFPQDVELATVCTT
jgi:hypothetical protein